MKIIEAHVHISSARWHISEDADMKPALAFGPLVITAETQEDAEALYEASKAFVASYRAAS